MLNLGTVDPGDTIYIPFESFASATGAPITITGLATSDIKVYKDGGTTERASASGYTLLDTDGIDFDGITGIHGFSINLADNTTADFWAAGSRYFVVVNAITVDSQTMSFIAAEFRIGKSGSLLDTTIATLSSQTSFTLTSGPAEDDALNGHWAIIHDAASAVQFARVLILDYTGSTKTVTLAAGATFTVAAKDNFSLMGMAPMQPATLGRNPVVDASGLVDANTVKLGPTGSGTAQTARDIGASVLLSSGTGTGQLDFTSGRVKADTVYFGGSAGSFTTGVPAVNTTLIAGSLVSTSTAQIGVNVVNAGGTAWGSGAITAASIANGAIDAATFAADVDAEILSYLVDDATRIDASALNTATVTTIPAILIDTAEIGTAGAGLTAVSTGVTRKRIAPGGGGDYTSLSAAITDLASTAGIIELVCSAGDIGAGNLHSLAAASEVILRADAAARHRHDTAQPLAETAYFASTISFAPTTTAPSKITIDGLRSSGVGTYFNVVVNHALKTYHVHVNDCFFHNSGTGGGAVDQGQYFCTQGVLHILHTNNTHIHTATGKGKGYLVAVVDPAGGETATIYCRVYGNTGNSNGGTLITDTGSVIDGFGCSGGGNGGTEAIYLDIRNNVFCGVVPAVDGTVGAIGVFHPLISTVTGSNNFTSDGSASFNGLTSGTTSVVVADVFESYLTTNRQLSTAATRDAGYSLSQEIMGRRVKSGSVWDIGSHEFQAGLSATQLGYVNTSLSTLATSNALASLVSTVGAAGAGLTSVVLAATGLDAISTTAPSGVASNFREMMVQTWRRFFKKSTLTATQLKTYADDGTTVVTTQTVSDDATTQTQGASS